MKDISLMQDVAQRVKNVQRILQAMKLDACILSTGVNIFYLSGKMYNGYLYLPAEGDVIHFVKRAAVELDNVITIHKPELIKEALAKKGIILPKNIALEKDVLSFNSITRLASALEVDPTQVQDASYLMRRIRSEKTDYEIEQIKICAKQHQAVYKLIPSFYKKGMRDIDLQIEIEKAMRQHGSIGIFRSYGENMDIFMGSLLSGDNANAVSPYDFALGGAGTSESLPLGASGRMLKEGDAIMVDMAGNYTPWMTDMTRVFSIGKLSDLAYRAHQVSIDILNKIVSMAKIGTSCSEIYNIANEMVKAEQLEAYFMGHNLQAKFVGHGVGLEINELPVLTPRSKEILTKNTVLAIEPKFVIPGVGAVGIENTYVVTENGLEKLTEFEENIMEL